MVFLLQIKDSDFRNSFLPGGLLYNRKMIKFAAVYRQK